MGSGDEVIKIDSLERRLLESSISNEDSESNDEIIIYRASFEDMEDSYVKYQTIQWILYSLLLILAWGIGLFLLLYLPIRRYNVRKDFQSRKLYVTPDAIIYKVIRPAAFPCFGVLKKEKHIVLPSVTDIVVEQGYLQSLFGIYSIRIENSGVRKLASDDVQIQGITHPRDFRKVVLTRLSSMSESFSQQAYITENAPCFGSGLSPGTSMPPSRSRKSDLLPSFGELILQKLEVVGNSVKSLQMLIEKRTRSSENLVRLGGENPTCTGSRT